MAVAVWCRKAGPHAPHFAGLGDRRYCSGLFDPLASPVPTVQDALHELRVNATSDRSYMSPEGFERAIRVVRGSGYDRAELVTLLSELTDEEVWTVEGLADAIRGMVEVK